MYTFISKYTSPQLIENTLNLLEQAVKLLLQNMVYDTDRYFCSFSSGAKYPELRFRFAEESTPKKPESDLYYGEIGVNSDDTYIIIDLCIYECMKPSSSSNCKKIQQRRLRVPILIASDIMSETFIGSISTFFAMLERDFQKLIDGCAKKKGARHAS